MNAIHLGRILLAVLAVGIALNAAVYFVVSWEDIPFSSQAQAYADLGWIVQAHIGGGGVALALGALQFFPAIRRAVGWHRGIGRVYVGAVLIGGLAGFPVALEAHGGVSNTVAFSLLALFWLYSTAMAFLAIRGGDVASHRMWMTRSYALTFAAVTLRLELLLLQGVAGLSFDEAYSIVPWSCWVLNLVVVEWFVQTKRA